MRQITSKILEKNFLLVPHHNAKKFFFLEKAEELKEEFEENAMVLIRGDENPVIPKKKINIILFLEITKVKKIEYVKACLLKWKDASLFTDKIRIIGVVLYFSENLPEKDIREILNLPILHLIRWDGIKVLVATEKDRVATLQKKYEEYANLIFVEKERLFT